jgi:ribosomal subunit interface protein
MTLRVSGKNLDIGLAFRTHIETRIDTALAKYRAGLVAGHVTVEPEGSGFRADCTLHLSSGATLQADAQAQEPYASFNSASDLIENLDQGGPAAPRGNMGPMDHSRCTMRRTT